MRRNTHTQNDIILLGKQGNCLRSHTHASNTLYQSRAISTHTNSEGCRDGDGGGDGGWVTKRAYALDSDVANIFV